jgi:hypothetical protein
MFLAGMTLVLLSCASPEPADRGGSAMSDSTQTAAAAAGLLGTLGVRVSGDTVQLILDVLNAGNAPVTLEFATAQRYEFEVRTESGDEVWRWSADQMFGQVVGQEVVAAGGSLVYRAVWVPGSRRGAFRATGRVVSTSHPLTLEMAFEVPGG